MHLAATETYYSMNTFENKPWDSWSEEIKKKWDPAMNLGDAGRKAIKGHESRLLPRHSQRNPRTLARRIQETR